MIITRAATADVDTIMSWRRERVAWLKEHGEDQWSIPLPRSAVTATVSAGQTWMVWDAWTTNPRLHGYYVRQGARHVRTVESRVSGACFQRPAQPYHGYLKTDGE